MLSAFAEHTRVNRKRLRFGDGAVSMACGPLATALVALEQLPSVRQPKRNIADMKMLLNSLYPPSDVSIHLTTARWRFLPNLRPLGAREI
jgi:hypothetical protein